MGLETFADSHQPCALKRTPEFSAKDLQFKHSPMGPSELVQGEPLEKIPCSWLQQGPEATAPLAFLDGPTVFSLLSCRGFPPTVSVSWFSILSCSSCCQLMAICWECLHLPVALLRCMRTEEAEPPGTGLTHCDCVLLPSNNYSKLFTTLFKAL